MSKFTGIQHGLSHTRGDGTGSSHDAIMGSILLAVIIALVVLVNKEIIPGYMGWILFIVITFILVGLFS